MYQEIYDIAGHIIKIESIYKRVHHLCCEYRCNKSPELFIFINYEDIIKEQQISARNDKKAGRLIQNYSEDYLETLAVYRKLSEQLIEYDIVLFHGSVVAVDGIGYLFIANSGTGKSTHTKLWMEQFKERAVMINDDKPLLKITESGILAYGTPWDGKHHRSTNTVVPLKVICLLHRAEENYVEKAEKYSIYPMILQQIYRPTDEEKLKKTLSLFDRLLTRVELYSLYCNMEPEAAMVAYREMNQKQENKK